MEGANGLCIDCSAPCPGAGWRDWPKIIETIDEATVRRILVYAAYYKDIPAAQILLARTEVQDEARPQRLKEDDAKRREFTSTWNDIRSALREPFDTTGEELLRPATALIEQVREGVQSIEDAVTSRGSSTLISRAFFALYNIGYNVVAARGTIGHQVRTHFLSDHCLEEAMRAIIMAMTPAELTQFVNDDREQGVSFSVLNIRYLRNFARNYDHLFEKLDGILFILDGYIKDYGDHDRPTAQEWEEDESSSDEGSEKVHIDNEAS